MREHSNRVARDTVGENVIDQSSGGMTRPEQR